jgi:benzoate/toluate 1,2-dioxygenase reductase subunit
VTTSTSHRVTVRFRDGAATEVRVPAGWPILDAAIHADLPLVHQCRSGSCGTCVARLVAGTVEVRGRGAVALLASEIAAGYRLTCSSFPLTDCAIELDYPRAAIRGPAPTAAVATVAAVERASRSVYVLDLEAPAMPAFAAGQYARLKVPETEEWRSYSMATTARTLPRLRLFVRYLEGGAMSVYVRERVRPGDRMAIEAPYGAFTLAEPAKPQLMIAGGTGLAPMLALLDELRAAPGRKPAILLCFGCTESADFFGADELALRAHWMPSLVVRTAVMYGPPPPGTVSGTALDLIGAADLTPATVAYLCGPPAMIEAGRTRLLAGGLAAANIRAEVFRPSQA